MKKFYTSMLMMGCMVIAASAQHSASQIAAKELDRQAALVAQQSMAQPMGGSGCALGFYTVISENFESGQPAGWTFTTTGSDAWQFGTQTNGLNGPVSGSWASVNDDANDAIGIAVATSPAVNANGGDVSVSFYYDFQAFAGIDNFYVEFWNGSAWVFVNPANQFFASSTPYCTDDCVGTITLVADAANFGNSDFRFRLTYSDENDWGWGLGFDDVLVCAQVPPNDLCTGAVPLSCGIGVTGTTVGSSDADNPTGCVVFSDDLGVWYSFAGTGSAVQLSTCGSTSDASGVIPWIAVFEGSCGAVTCVASGSTQDLGCGTNGFVTAEIPTVLGTTYYVYMTAAAGFPLTMDFNLTLICLPPANDDCADAIALSCGDVVSGSTTVATIDGPSTDCSGGSVAADVWYTVSGTGYDITASLCGSGYDTQLDIYTGSCGSLVNNGGCNDDFCGLQSELTWTSTLGETYHIRVHGFGGNTGPYTLALTCYDCNGDAGGTAFIDDCGICAGGNTGITPGNSVTLDMTDSWGDGWNGATYSILDNSDPLNPVPVASGALDNAASGNGLDFGQDILCLPDGCYLFSVGGGEFDGEIGWTLTGVDGGPLTGGATGGVEFSINTAACPIAGCTDPGSLNYDPAATVDDGSCIYPPSNDDCAGAITIDCSDSGLTGTTINSTVDAEYTNCGAGGTNTTQRGVWYKVIGDNQQYTITTCDAGGVGYDTRLTVYSGNCGSLSCVTGNDDMSPACSIGGFRSEVTFNANAGTDYYVYVHGFQTDPNLSAVGNFILNITCSPLCLPVPANDDCASAQSLSVSGSCTPTTGTTQCAGSTPSNPTCFSAFATLADVWYSFVAPADGEATMNITNVSAVGTGYAVYDACGGAEVACSSTYTSGTDVAWTGLTPGATYYVQVMTNGVVNAGDFTICVSGNVPDCNGDLGGSAFLDDCNVCVGGNTGLTACVQDCNGDFGGTAVLDNCNVCVGGNTGLTACVQDCNGDFGGTAVLDNCNECVGGNTGLTACVQDCNGDFGGTAVLDDCNVCVGGNTGLIACVQDCNGDFGGTAVLDDCNVCVGGNTGLTACVQDCNGDFGGTAFIDDCNMCVGGDTGLEACVQDCNGEWGGLAFIDDCDDCVGGGTGLDACDPVGVSESLDRSLNVYPNPNNGQFIVELNGAEGVGTLNIMDMMGRRVYTSGVNFNGSFRQSIDLNVAKGTYVLQVITENGIATRKVELH